MQFLRLTWNLLPHLQECELGLLERGQPSQEINLRKLVVSHVHLQLPPPRKLVISG